MMMARFWFLGSLLVGLTSGFVLVGRCRQSLKPATHLYMSSVLVPHHQDELTSRILLNKARECAFSDYTNGIEAKAYLTKILEIESGCVSGMLAGNELCGGNVVELAEIVAHLRQKVLDDRPSSPVAASSTAIVSVSIGIAAVVLASALN